MSFLSVTLFLIFSSYYAIQEIQRMEIDPRKFIAAYEKDVTADLNNFFDFFRHVHVLEKVLKSILFQVCTNL